MRQTLIAKSFCILMHLVDIHEDMICVYEKSSLQKLFARVDKVKDSADDARSS
jgi:hypothetical protein